MHLKTWLCCGKSFNYKPTVPGNSGEQCKMGRKMSKYFVNCLQYTVHTRAHTHMHTHIHAHTYTYTHTHNTHTPPYSLLCVSNNIQVRHAWLHHQDVRSFPHITFLGKRTEVSSVCGHVIQHTYNSPQG